MLIFADMETHNFPKYEFRTRVAEGKEEIFDEQRRKWVRLTPEERVRQHMVRFLIDSKQYPAQLISNEASLTINGMSKRCDTVVYDRDMKARVILEYKAPSVSITEKTFDQIAMYNIKFQVDILIVSNGINHYCCKVNKESNSYTFLREIPSWDLIVKQ